MSTAWPFSTTVGHWDHCANDLPEPGWNHGATNRSIVLLTVKTIDKQLHQLPQHGLGRRKQHEANHAKDKDPT